MALLLGTLMGCGRLDAGGAPDSRPAPTPHPHGRFDAEIALDNGGRAGMYYAAGRGLMEQHLDAGATRWSSPHLVHRTGADPCLSVTLKRFRGVVAAIANWGPYCADGEPPTESIAAVGSMGLSKWDTEVTKDFDGWEKVTASDGQRELTFTNASTESVTRLRWNRAVGFSDVEEIPR
ncbi:hypothetical protein [Streptomyces sp. NBC_00344]|uniref:hypothetical protein n=1 Tax=Streptomyces sp. NBC_00344 TaxID=2975720 RepID=UPI002E243632